MSQSYCLYDDGEEAWSNKLHLGCGGIYLRGYINCDIAGLVARNYPDLVEANTTDISNYYARLEGNPLHLPTRRETVADLISDVATLPYKSHTIDKIVAVQVFEHLSPVKAIDALYHWRMLLKHGQPLVMSVPDMAGTLSLFGDGRDNAAFALRHLRGRQGDEYNSHHAWYTHDTFYELVEFCGFRVFPLDNFHFYPAIVVRAIKR